MMRPLRFALLASLALTMCLVASEIGRRILDGYRVWGLELVTDPTSTDLTWSDGRSTEAMLRTIRLDIEARSAWFYERPQPIQGVSPAWADARRAAAEPAANYVWNAARLDDASLLGLLTKHRDRVPKAFTFRAPGDAEYPFYRLYPEIDTGWGLTNQFGWRGRPITAEKPADVIRIGVLGDSTTNAYPGMIEHWLNLWAVQRDLGVRFEVINAARPATGALDAAAIFEFELGSADVDYAIVYGFGNNISFADDLIKLPPGIVKGQPVSETKTASGALDGVASGMSAMLEPLVPWSAAAGFLRRRVMGQRGGSLVPEPRKPETQLVFPAGIDEFAPDPERIARHEGGGLMLLGTYLRGLNQIDEVAKKADIGVFVSTFRVMATDGMLLNTSPSGSALLYDVLNKGYWWPYTYRQIQRLTDFHNRTLRAWADAHEHSVIPVNEQMPWRPELYGDGIHSLPTGEALHGWIVLQQLMPRIRADLARRRLPRAGRPRPPGLDRYWQIDEVDVAAVIDKAAKGAPVPPASSASPEAATARAPAETIAGAFPLAKLVAAYDKAEVVAGDVPQIRTAAESSAYAAAIQVEASVVSQLTGSGWVEVRIRVNQGGVTIGVLDNSGGKFLTYANLSRAPEIQAVRLPLDDLSAIGTLMISNNRPGEAERSIAELHGVELKRSRP